MQDSPLGSWRNRRKFMITVIGFTMAAILLAMLGPVPPAVAEVVVSFGFMLLFGVTGSYVFGAAWDDSNKMKNGGRAS